jgi:MraZ protein
VVDKKSRVGRSGHLAAAAAENDVLFLTGTYYHAVDAKSRLTVPAKLREAILPIEERSAFYIVQAYDKVLYLFTPGTYRERVPEFDAELEAVPDVRDINRLRFALAEYAAVDRLGRVLIPEQMLRRAGIEKEVAILGVRDHIEVWDRARWDAYVDEQLARHDELAERTLKLRRAETPEPEPADQA